MNPQPVWAGTLPCHNCKTHSNRRAGVLNVPGSLHKHKNTGRHQQALFRFSDIRRQGR